MSLRNSSSRIIKAIYEGVPATGPPSLRTRWSRLRYKSPEHMQPAFEEALKIINKDSENQKIAAQNASSSQVREELYAKSDIYNPEVQYNDFVNYVDLSNPTYKLLAKRRWLRRSMPTMMQRIEQLHVIPDTLPTLMPEAETKIKFLLPKLDFIDPGAWVRNDICMRTPQISISDFSLPAGTSGHYTVAIVNPDIPDLENDSFNTDLHFLATNVEASLANPIANWAKSSVLKPYMPPVPEKNAPGQRMCVWVMRQENGHSSNLENKELVSEFDLRSFVSEQNLRPVSAFVWRSKWDYTSPAVREKLGLPRGRVFYRARTEFAEDSVLHITERPKWQKVDELYHNE